jgi:pimeloyl-ACP methyl ester carboxylesterase
MRGVCNRTIAATVAIAAALFAAVPVAAQERGPLALASASYFFVGGRIDPSVEGAPTVGQMYVEFMVPARRSHPYPIVMVHGGSQTGTNFTGTPDGREGWAQYFVRRGYAVYVVDQVARGRSAYWSQVYGPVLPSRFNFVEQRFVAPERFKQWPQAHLHTQWPGTGKPGDSAFDQFYASQFPSLASFPKQQEINRDALVALLDKIGPAILLTHSQSGAFNWPVAEARPNLIKALVAVEPSGPPVHDIENIGAPDWFKDAERTKVSGLADVPLAYDPPVPAGGQLEFVRQEKPDKPDLVRCWLQKEYPGRDLCRGGFVPRRLRPLHRGLSHPGGRAQHAHPPVRCRSARQRPHDDDREEQCRHRRRDRAMARPSEPARAPSRKMSAAAAWQPAAPLLVARLNFRQARLRPARSARCCRCRRRLAGTAWHVVPAARPLYVGHSSEPLSLGWSGP